MTTNNNMRSYDMTTTSVTTEQVPTELGWCAVYVTTDGDFGNRFVGFGYATVDEVEEATAQRLALDEWDSWNKNVRRVRGEST